MAFRPMYPAAGRYSRPRADVPCRGKRRGADAGFGVQAYSAYTAGMNVLTVAAILLAVLITLALELFLLVASWWNDE